jgi:folate-binding protein YgfZ
MLGRMNRLSIYQLDHLSVVDVSGADAGTIVHNLTTNEVRSLNDGEGRESFVTDVRGKTLGHVGLFRQGDFLRLLGPAGQSEAIRSHVDRYTIREDATVEIRDDQYVAFVISPELAQQCGLKLNEGVALKSLSLPSESGEVTCYGVCWLGEGTVVLCLPSEQTERAFEILRGQAAPETDLADLELAGEDAFHEARVMVGFPWYGIDLDDSNLPQEADRDLATISFTKGCYLGQETVARLDALGQVQKKLVRWKITGGVPETGATLMADEKKVARLTSVASADVHSVVALGFARRSHFDAGTTAEGRIEMDSADDSGITITGTVM